MLADVLRNWITGKGPVLATLLWTCGLVSCSTARNGDTTRPAKFFHEETYGTGIEFRYPATWKDVKGERDIAGFRGARGCEVNISEWEDLSKDSIAKYSADLQQFAAQLSPGSQFGQRPAWAGSQPPAASFAQTTGKGKGLHKIEWDTIFGNNDDKLTLTELMQEGDTDCVSDLVAIEKSFRLFPTHLKAPTASDASSSH